MRFFNVFRKEWIWAGLSILALLLFSYIPLIRNFHIAPSDRFYYGGEEYPLDMTGNLAYVQEGFHGEWLAHFNYSTFITDPGSLVKFEYILIGQFARLFRIDPIVFFFLARFIISLGFLTLIYLVARKLWNRVVVRISALLLVLFGAGIVLTPGNSFVDRAVFDALVFERLTLSMPHYLIGGLCAVGSLVCLSKVLTKPHRYGVFLCSIILGVVSVFSYAPDVVLLVSGFPLYVIFSLIHRFRLQKRLQIDMTQLGILFAYAVTMIAPVVYIRYVYSWVWKDVDAGRMEQLNPFSLNTVEYLLVVGIPYVIAIVSLPRVIRKGKPFMMMLGTWIVMHPIGEFVLSRFLSLNPIRYFLTPYYIAFGLLAAEGVYGMSAWITKRVPRVPFALVCLVLTGGILLSSVSTYRANYSRANLCFCLDTYFDYAYPKKNLVGAMYWLKDHTNYKDIVFSGYYTGTLIPAFSGNHVYISWWYRLIGPSSVSWVETTMKRFYEMDMSNVEAGDLLKSAGISYVMYGNEERVFTNPVNALTYPFLKEVYNKDGIVIYTVVLPNSQ